MRLSSDEMQGLLVVQDRLFRETSSYITSATDADVPFNADTAFGVYKEQPRQRLQKKHNASAAELEPAHIKTGLRLPCRKAVLCWPQLFLAPQLALGHCRWRALEYRVIMKQCL